MSLKNFPKIRPELPPKYQSIYEKHCLENRQGKSNASAISSRMEAWMHLQVSKDVIGIEKNIVPTLELGAGTLNHLQYEKHTKPYDIVEPNDKNYANSPWIKNVRKVYNIIFDVPLTEKYDRIISIATLEHLTDLPRVIAKCGLHLTDNGLMRIGIPNEGTILWRLGYALTTGIEFRLRYNLSYSKIMKYEHVNTANEIESVLAHFFRIYKCFNMGVNKKLAFYRFYECGSPDKIKCNAIL